MEGAAGRTVPHDAGAEKAFLGALLIDPSAVNNAITLLFPDDFFNPRHRVLFSAIIDLYNAKFEIDPVTLGNHLTSQGKLREAGGVEYMNELLEVTPTSSNLEYYARIVRDKAILRSLIQASGEIADLAYNAPLDISEVTNSAESRLFEITDRNLTKSWAPIQEILTSTFQKIQAFRQHGATGLLTGFDEFDRMTSGLHGGELIVVAGRPASGKTAFCLNVATRVAIQSGKPVLFFSLEMNKEELCMRMLCSEAQLENTKLKQGMINRRETNNLMMAASKLHNTQLIIDDKPDITITEARAKARRIKNERGELALIIIDYIQLVEGPRDMPRHERYTIISDVSRSMKQLAKELDVPVIALSQLSRKIEERTSRTPMLSDLRESGAIEQDADIVAFIHRNYIYSKDESEKNAAELIVGKHRNGPTGSVPLFFRGEFLRFDNGETAS